MFICTSFNSSYKTSITTIRHILKKTACNKLYDLLYYAKKGIVADKEIYERDTRIENLRNTLNRWIGKYDVLVEKTKDYFHAIKLAPQKVADFFKSLFDKEKQDTHSGGSGCACIASVFSGYFYQMLKEKKINKVLLIATGALMNSTSSGQGESIPGIAHAVAIENLDN